MSRYTTTTITCACGLEFTGTTRSRLGLCPTCKRQRQYAQHRSYSARTHGKLPPLPRRPVPDISADLEGWTAGDEPGRPVYQPFGPVYGFASLGDLYGANDGRLQGKRIRRDLLALPVSVRPGNVLEPIKREVGR